MATHHNQFFNDSPLTKVTLNKRLEESSWGFFLLLIGTLLLLPTELVPQGTWLIGAGFIMLVLNCVRYVNGISASGFTVVLGCCNPRRFRESPWLEAATVCDIPGPSWIKHHRKVFASAEGRLAQQVIR